jgi:hypothetical protein
VDEAAVAVPVSFNEVPEAKREEVRAWLGLPDTHPTTRLAAAAHEAAHVVVAATLGFLPARAWIGQGDGPDGPAGAMELTLPERFGLAALADAIACGDSTRRARAERDLDILCCIRLAAYAFYEEHALPAKWSCLGDVVEVSDLLEILPGSDEDGERMIALLDEVRRLLRRPDVRVAANALTAELLEYGEVSRAVIAEACREIMRG